MSARQPAQAGRQPEAPLLALYDRALPQVYGYLVPRCASVADAEDLTADVFLAAAERPPAELTVAWLIGVARHKLVDQWRRQERDDRRLHALATEAVLEDDPWDTHLDRARAHQVLAGLTGDHRAVLTLRYLDGLSVAETAATLDRTVHATEALLVRARRAFRRSYEESARRD